MEGAKLSRRQRKAVVTRYLGDLSILIAENDSEAVSKKLDRIKGTFREFQKAHITYHDMLLADPTISDDDITASEKWFAEAESKYVAGVSSANKWLNCIRDCNVSVVEDNKSDQATGLMDIMQMPKVKIDVFSGDPMDYHSFIAMFDENVDSKKVDAQVKLTRLLQYTSGRAKSAIKYCSLVGGEQGYQQARNILKERFGNDYLVSQKIQSQLKSGKPIRKSEDLQQLADDLSIASATLGKLSMTSEIDNQHSIVSILERCPQYVQNKWTKKALKHKRENSVYPGFDSLVRFMNEIATEACDPVFGHDDKMSKGAKGNKSDMTSGSYVMTVTNTSESNTVNPVHTSSSPKGPCALCAQNHRLFACDAFRAMGPQERFGVLKNYKLCFNCLMSGHRAYKCKKPGRGWPPFDVRTLFEGCTSIEGRRTSI